MQYRKNKTGEDISLLGYGCMRFTRKNGGIDIGKWGSVVDNGEALADRGG